MLPTQMGLEQQDLDAREVQRLLAEGAVSRCFARHKLLLDVLLKKTGISVPANVIERIQYLVVGDQYIEIKTSGEEVSFRLLKVLAPAS